ncbi:unnamed protein product, partial [Pleuronectes platessa]
KLQSDAPALNPKKSPAFVGHLLILVKLVMSVLIPDEPDWIRRKREHIEFTSMEALKQQKLQSDDFCRLDEVLLKLVSDMHRHFPQIIRSGCTCVCQCEEYSRDEKQETSLERCLHPHLRTDCVTAFIPETNPRDIKTVSTGIEGQQTIGTCIEFQTRRLVECSLWDEWSVRLPEDEGGVTLTKTLTKTST